MREAGFGAASWLYTTHTFVDIPGATRHHHNSSQSPYANQEILKSLVTVIRACCCWQWGKGRRNERDRDIHVCNSVRYLLIHTTALTNRSPSASVHADGA